MLLQVSCDLRAGSAAEDCTVKPGILLQVRVIGLKKVFSTLLLAIETW